MASDPTFRDIVTAAAQKHGINPSLLLGIAHVESSDGTDKRVSSAGAKGPFQFVPKTAEAYGLTDPTDVSASADAAARLAKDNIAGLTRALGRVPTNGEVYLAHQQGVGGAIKLIQNPTANAAKLLGGPQVTQNGGTEKMSAEQFAGTWTKRFDGSGDTRSSSGGGGSTPALTLSDIFPDLKHGPSAAVPDKGMDWTAAFRKPVAPLFKPIAPLGEPPPPPPTKSDPQPTLEANPGPVRQTTEGPLATVRAQLAALTAEAKQRYL